MSRLILPALFLMLAGSAWAGTTAVTSVSPNSGVLAGGTTVQIRGTGFPNTLATTDVTFGGVDAATVVWVSATRITCTTPPGAAPGPVAVIVEGVNGGNLFSYTNTELVINVRATIRSVVDIAWGDNTQTDSNNVAHPANSIAAFNWTVGDPGDNDNTAFATIATAYTCPYTIDIRNRSSTGNAVDIDATADYTGAVLYNNVDNTVGAQNEINFTAQLAGNTAAHLLDTGATFPLTDLVPIPGSNGEQNLTLIYTTPTTISGPAYDVLQLIVVTLTATKD